MVITYAVGTSTYCETTEYASPRHLDTRYVKKKKCCKNSGTGSATTLHSIWNLESDTLRFSVDRSNTHTLKIHSTTPIQHPYILSIGGVQYCYDGTIEFHWGENTKGSEHKINHKQYAMEAHYIHYKCNLDSVTEALDYWVNEAYEDPNTTPVLAIVAVFFEISNKHRNDGIDEILNGFNQNHHFHINLFDNGLLPKDDTGFFNYHGSTTTSKCYPVVNWIVADSPGNLYIHSEQLNELRRSTGISSNCKSIKHSDQDIFSNTCLHSSMNNVRRLAEDGDECNDDLPADSDEVDAFIRQFRSVCNEVDGLIDHEVFQSAVNQMLESVADINSDHTVFERAYQFHMAIMAAWQALRENCQEESTRVAEELQRLQDGKTQIIADTKRRAKLQHDNQMHKFNLLLPQMSKLHSKGHKEIDCTDCENSDNEGLSNVATSMNKLQHLGNMQSKAQNAIFESVFDSISDGPNVSEMIKVINEKINKKAKEGSLFAQCINLATGKINHLESDTDFSGIQEDMLQYDAHARNETQSLVRDTLKTFYELTMGE